MGRTETETKGSRAVAEKNSETAKVLGLTYFGWAAVYVAAVFLLSGLSGAGIISSRYTFPLLLLLMVVLVPPMAWAQMRWRGKRGISSPALIRYNRNFLIAFFFYFIPYMGLAYWRPAADVGKAGTIAIAAVATLPALAMVLVMARYLVEENDEYLRQKAIISALVGLALVLTLGSFWGFLEMFGLAPVWWSWWVFPVWAIGLGLGNFWHFVSSE